MIDENSTAYKTWKSFYGISRFEEGQYGRFLCYEDANKHTWKIDNIAIKDFGSIQYLSWTETNGYTKLMITELEPHRHRRLDWAISRAKSNCFFWVNKWTEEGLHILYNDGMTNYALRVQLNKKPDGLSLQTTELGQMLCIKRNWLVGFKFYTDKDVSLFDLKAFRYLDKLTEDESRQRNIIPTEEGENDEELE